MVELKTAAEIEQMRVAGRAVASALAAVKKEAAVGMSLRELDNVATAGARTPRSASASVRRAPRTWS
jgi:methionyl aminopeptidase